MQPNFNIEDDGEELNSPLPELRSVQPYKLPEGYFDGLAEKIIAACAGATEAEPELPKDNPYQVPDGYFDGLAARSMKKISAERKAVRTIPLKRYVRLAAAAIVLLCVGIGIYPWNKPVTNPAMEQIAQLDQQSVSDYVNENIDDFDVALLEENAKLDPSDLNTFSNEDIKAYLENEDGITPDQKTN